MISVHTYVLRSKTFANKEITVDNIIYAILFNFD